MPIPAGENLLCINILETSSGFLDQTHDRSHISK